MVNAVKIFSDIKLQEIRSAFRAFKRIAGGGVGSLAFSAGISMIDKLPLKNRLQHIDYCVVNNAVAERNHAYNALFWVVDFELAVGLGAVGSVYKGAAKMFKIFFGILSEQKAG